MKKTKKTDANNSQQSSATIETLFADAITRVKADAAQAIAKQKAASEAQAWQMQQMIVNIEAECEQKLAKANLNAEVTIANEKAQVIKAAERVAKIKTKEEI